MFSVIWNANKPFESKKHSTKICVLKTTRTNLAVQKPIIQQDTSIDTHMQRLHMHELCASTRRCRQRYRGFGWCRAALQGQSCSIPSNSCAELVRSFSNFTKARTRSFHKLKKTRRDQRKTRAVRCRDDWGHIVQCELIKICMEAAVMSGGNKRDQRDQNTGARAAERGQPRSAGANACLSLGQIVGPRSRSLQLRKCTMKPGGYNKNKL
jgi:hypothetical protein